MLSADPPPQLISPPLGRDSMTDASWSSSDKWNTIAARAFIGLGAVVGITALAGGRWHQVWYACGAAALGASFLWGRTRRRQQGSRPSQRL